MLHEDLKGFFDGFPRDAHPMPVLSSAVVGAVDLLPGHPGPVRPRAGRDLDDPPARQAADHRGLRVQEVDRPAAALPGQLAVARRELPADDVRRPGRASTRSTPTIVKAARPAASSCTPTTSRTARRRTVRLVGSSQANLFASVSAGINALFGPAARRRQPGRARDAREHPAPRASTDAVHGEGQGQGGRRPAHGLRAPGLQELRPARHDHQGHRARHARPSSACSDALLEIAMRARGDRPRRRLLRRAQAVPERRLLHRASSTRRWAFPTQMFTVLFALGRLPGWIAQWREMIAATRRPRSAARARSTPVRASATTSRSTSADPPPPPPPHPGAFPTFHARVRATRRFRRCRRGRRHEKWGSRRWGAGVVHRPGSSARLSTT